MQPSVPEFGGSTVSGRTLPLPLTLIWKVPLDDFLICTVLIGPFSYLESLYLNPFTGSPLQYCLPVAGLVVWGRLNVWLLEEPPFASTVSVAPVTVGFPTMVLELAFSFALPVSLAIWGVLGFLSESELPRID